MAELLFLMRSPLEEPRIKCEDDTIWEKVFTNEKSLQMYF